VFPDFLARHRRESARWFFIELLGFWTADLVKRLLHRPLDSVLCVDEDRLCGDDEPPEHPRLVRYRRRVDPEEVLRAGEALQK
jgi:hypothetical protein